MWNYRRVPLLNSNHKIQSFLDIIMSTSKAKRDRANLEDDVDPLHEEEADSKKETKKKQKVTENAVFELRKWK